MKIKNLNTAFFVTVGISVVVFIYLVFLGYDEIKTLKDVIKIVASIMFPIPLIFFTRFILVEHFMPENTDEYKLKNQKPATVLLIITIVACVSLMYVIELITKQQLEDQLIFAHLVNSTAVSSYVLNYVIYNNLKVNAILSGVLIALAVNVFFLSA